MHRWNNEGLRIQLWLVNDKLDSEKSKLFEKYYRSEDKTKDYENKVYDKDDTSEPSEVPLVQKKEEIKTNSIWRFDSWR